MVSLAACSSKFPLMNLVFISLIFMTSLPQFVWGLYSPLREIEDPGGLKPYTTVDPQQSALPQRYVDLHPALNTQGWSPPKVLRETRFFDPLHPFGLGKSGGMTTEDKKHPSMSKPQPSPPTSTPTPTPPEFPTKPVADTTTSTSTSISISTSPSTLDTTSTLNSSIFANNSLSTETTSASSSQLSNNPSTENTSTITTTSSDKKSVSPTKTSGGGSLAFNTSLLVVPTSTTGFGGPEEAPPPVTPTSVKENPNRRSPSRVGAIVGGSLGGMVLVSLIGVCICISRQRRRERRGDWTTSSRSIHNSLGSVEWHARLDDTMHRAEIERNENRPYGDGESGHSGSGVESNLLFIDDGSDVETERQAQRRRAEIMREIRAAVASLRT